MLSSLTKIVKLNHVHAIGIIRNDTGDTYQCMTVRKYRNTIKITSKAVFTDYEKMVASIDPKLPVILLVDGKGILNKKVDFKNEADVNWYKNIDFSSIYFTSLKSSESSFISFCRKNITDEALSRLKGSGYQVADIYVGSFLSALLQASVNGSVLANGLRLEFENGHLSGFTKQSLPEKQEEYQIGTDTISGDLMPVYGAIFHFFVQPHEVQKTKNDLLNVEEIVYRKLFSVLGVSILAGFFIALLSSYLLIQYYGARTAELNLQSVYSDQSYKQMLDFEKQKQNKELILKKSGFLSSRFLSFYGYEIIKGIPGDISLNGLNIVPLQNDVKAGKKMEFETMIIIVKGETFVEASFNTWIEHLKKMEWLKNFEIISFKKDKKNKASFEVRITLKDV